MRKSARYLGRDVGLNAEEVNVWLKEEGYLEGEPGDYRVTRRGVLMPRRGTGKPEALIMLAMFPRHGKRKSSMKLARFPRNADVSFPIRCSQSRRKEKAERRVGGIACGKWR